MPDLTPREIDIISNSVRAHGITFSHLPDDLIDHLCCDVENLMHQGISFTDAFAAVRRNMGSYRRLREIQEETLFAVDIKYRKMKTTMKISGITGTILFGLASLFKIMHWPLAGVMMVLGAITLTLVFMPSALGVLWKETRSTRRLFLFISAFLTALFTIGGILFKVQHWPGAGIVITLSALVTILLLLPAVLHNVIVSQERRAAPAVYVISAAGTALYVAGFFFRIMHWPLATTLNVVGLLTLFLVAFPWYVYSTMKNETHVRPEFIFLVVGSLAVFLPASLVTMIVNDGRDNSIPEMVDNHLSSGINSEKTLILSGIDEIIPEEKGDRPDNTTVTIK